MFTTGDFFSGLFLDAAPPGVYNEIRLNEAGRTLRKLNAALEENRAASSEVIDVDNNEHGLPQVARNGQAVRRLRRAGQGYLD